MRSDATPKRDPRVDPRIGDVFRKGRSRVEAMSPGEWRSMRDGDITAVLIPASSATPRPHPRTGEQVTTRERLTRSTAHRRANLRLMALVLAYWRIQRRRAEQLRLPMEGK